MEFTKIFSTCILQAKVHVSDMIVRRPGQIKMNSDKWKLWKNLFE